MTSKCFENLVLIDTIRVYLMLYSVEILIVPSSKVVRGETRETYLRKGSIIHQKFESGVFSVLHSNTRSQQN